METEHSSDPTPKEANWNRFLLATVLFLGFEIVLIAGFGDYFFTGVISEPGVWLMIAVAALGYFLLGLCAGSWLSISVIWMPLAFVVALDPSIPADAWGSERLPLYGMWFYLSVVFLPAWGFGALLAKINSTGSGQTNTDQGT